jgi:hypothetical protein
MPGPLKNIGLLVFSIVVFKIFGKLLNNRREYFRAHPRTVLLSINAIGTSEVSQGGATGGAAAPWARAPGLAPQARLRVATSPLLLECCGMVGSAWFCTKLAFCSSLPLYAL